MNSALTWLYAHLEHVVGFILAGGATAFTIRQGSKSKPPSQVPLLRVVPPIIEQSAGFDALLRNLITKHEGQKLTKYQDSRGYWTVGVGHCIDPRAGCDPLDSKLWQDTAQTKISQATCDALLSGDIYKATVQATKNFSPWFQKLAEPRQAVILDMVFNMGFGTLKTFTTLLGLVAAGKYKEASEDMLQTKWAKQVGIRAVEDARMMLTGDWP